MPYLSQVTFAAAQPMTINYGSFVYHDTKIPWSAPTHNTPPRTLIGSEVDADGKLIEGYYWVADGDSLMAMSSLAAQMHGSTYTALSSAAPDQVLLNAAFAEGNTTALQSSRNGKTTLTIYKGSDSIRFWHEYEPGSWWDWSDPQAKPIAEVRWVFTGDNTYDVIGTGRVTPTIGGFLPEYVTTLNATYGGGTITDLQLRTVVAAVTRATRAGYWDEFGSLAIFNVEERREILAGLFKAVRTSADALAEAEKALAERYCRRVLENCIADWKAKDWDLAAALLELFLSHKNGETNDVKNLDEFASHIMDDPKLNRWVSLFLSGKARDNYAGTLVSFHNKYLGHYRWLPGEGEPFYAYAGVDIYLSGTLTVGNGNPTYWQFSGTVTLKDTYDFPKKWPRMYFNAYAAGAYLMEGHNYTTFKDTMSFTVIRHG